MKKYFSFAALLSVVAFVGCEDVPAPYEILPEGGTGGSDNVTTLPYSDASLNDWTAVTVQGAAWSLGNTYAKATGYDSGSKTTAETEAWLVSPAISLVTEDEAAHIEMEHVIRYVNASTAPLSNHTMWITTEFAGDVTAASWTQLDYKPVESATQTWDFYAADQIAIPSEFLNQTVYVAFKFVCGSSSTTWELKNFSIKEGKAEVGNNPGGDTPGGGDNPPATGAGSKGEPYNVASAQNASGNAWIKGFIVGFVDGQTYATGAKFEVPAQAETEILIADAADCTDATKCMPVQLPAGDLRTALELFANPSLLGKEVQLYGSIEKYFGVTGLKSTSCAILDGKTIGKDPEDNSVPTIPGTPSGEGTEASPYNVCKALTLIANNQMAATEIYVKGKICSIKEVDTGQYGNATFNISDDGTEAENGQLTIYRTMYLDGAKFSAADQIKVGDEVVVWGKLVLYGTTPEVTQGGKLISINGEGGTTGGGTGGGGTGGGTGGGGTGGTPVASITNGDFETWADGIPTGWKTASTAGNATISQSTDAHGGNYSVKVDGTSSANKRIAYQETTFEAGTYNVSFWVKAVDADCSVRPGYATFNADGTINSSGYKYGEYVNNVTKNDWIEVNYSFTLDAAQQICPLIMVSKNPGTSALIDDYTITKQ